MKDLLTGENNGRIRIFLNTNTDADPQFSGYTNLQLGMGIYDIGNYSVPWVVDWNNDGKKDVLCGDSIGKITYLENTGTDAKPIFSSVHILQDGAVNLNPGSVVSPCVVDFNSDGKKDLLVGASNGNVFYYENKGTDAAPLFNGNIKLQAGGGIIYVGSYARPTVADWDNDGTTEVLIGDDGGFVNLFDGRGPLFVTANTIIASTGGTVSFTLDAGARNAGRLYALFGSASGVEPGLPLSPGVVLPINWDLFTQNLISLYNTPVCNNFWGNLSANGEGAAILNTLGALPPNAVGMVMSFAFCLMDRPRDFASNGLNILIAP